MGSFKNKLHRDVKQVPKYYYGGNRIAQIHHTRMRLNCSTLNDFLYRCNLVDSPQCRCGAATENASHFLLDCPLYNVQRQQYLETLDLGNMFCMSVLLYGDPRKSFDWNCSVFRAVQMYIVKTKRFIVE